MSGFDVLLVILVFEKIVIIYIMKSLKNLLFFEMHRTKKLRYDI